MEHNRPSLVLLDLMLPGTDGIDLMRDIFGIADVPVIFLSAYGQDRVIAQAFETARLRLRRQALLAHRACGQGRRYSAQAHGTLTIRSAPNRTVWGN